MFSSVDALHVSAVLEDCVDQLSVLGHIMPSTLEGRPDASKVNVTYIIYMLYVLVVTVLASKFMF